jgi:hypothetical protein
MLIEDKLLKDITSYCELNNIDVATFVNDKLKKALMLEKYGERPFKVKPKPKQDKCKQPIGKIVESNTKPKSVKFDYGNDVIKEAPTQAENIIGIKASEQEITTTTNKKPNRRKLNE